VNTYIALLRGINVSGKNPIPMAKLRETFAALGFAEVRTYLQSGNVVFQTKKASTTAPNPSASGARNISVISPSGWSAARVRRRRTPARDHNIVPENADPVGQRACTRSVHRA